MSERKKHEQKLREEMESCMLLSEEDKKFWLDHAPVLPDVVLDNVIKIVKEKNNKVDEYVDAALEEDKDHLYLAELKAKIKKIKSETFELEEKGAKGALEEKLKKQLEEL